VTRIGASKHLDACAPLHDVASGGVESVGRFRVIAIGAPQYWIDVEARMSATLSSLDNLLRRTWLECCGHLSMFEVRPFRYLPVGVGSLDPFGRREFERAMSTRIGAAFAYVGMKGVYQYDFGSTTGLGLALTAAREGRLGRAAVRIATRNNPPIWPCAVCAQPASLVCCVHETDDSAFVCEQHQRKHACKGRAFLPVVNSPRMGVCGYAG